MKNTKKRVITALLVLANCLGALPSSASAETPREYAEFLKNNPKYQYATYIDMDGDGREELIAGTARFSVGFEVLTLCVVSDKEDKIEEYTLNSAYSAISYDPWNHALVGSGGGTGAFCRTLMMLENGHVFLTTVGYESRDYGSSRVYSRASMEYLPDENGETRILDGSYITENITEETCNRYLEYFRSLSPLELTYIGSSTMPDISAPKTCQNCGHQISTDSVYCPYCGRRLSDSSEGGWSEWSTVQTRASATIEVQTREVVFKYHMVHYGTQTTDSPHYRMFRNYSIAQDLSWNGARLSYGEKHFTRDVDPELLQYAVRYEPGTFISGDYPGYQMGNSTAYSFGDDKYVWFIKSADYVTEYRWRFR